MVVPSAYLLALEPIVNVNVFVPAITFVMDNVFRNAAAAPLIDTKPFLATLTLLVPPTCKSINSEAALLAVSVTLSFRAVGVPVVFHVPARSTMDCALEPVREKPDRPMPVVLAGAVNAEIGMFAIVNPYG